MVTELTRFLWVTSHSGRPVLRSASFPGDSFSVFMPDGSADVHLSPGTSSANDPDFLFRRSTEHWSFYFTFLDISGLSFLVFSFAVISSHNTCSSVELSVFSMGQSSMGQRQMSKDARNPVNLQTQRQNNRRKKKESCLQRQHCAVILKRSGLWNPCSLTKVHGWIYLPIIVSYTSLHCSNEQFLFSAALTGPEWRVLSIVRQHRAQLLWFCTNQLVIKQTYYFYLDVYHDVHEDFF